MKLALAALILLLTATSNAMDFSGYDVREIPIPQDKVAQAKRAEMLRPPTIDLAEFNAMTDAQKIEVIKALHEIQVAQRRFVAAEAYREREEDAKLNPGSLCVKAFGADFHYSGSAEYDGQDGSRQRSYLCAKDGPSTRTPFEQRMVALNGLRLHLLFKLRHPLTEWPG